MLLPKLGATAEARRNHSAQFLSLATANGHGQALTVDGTVYVRHDAPPPSRISSAPVKPVPTFPANSSWPSA